MTQQSQRILQFDILRAVAILLVLIHHVPKEWILNMDGTILPQFFWRFYTGGWIGVDMFFVLSGFLVSGIYFREYIKSGTISVGNFLIRRGFKIYPTFYVYILFSIVLSFFTSDLQLSSDQIIGELAFIQNYLNRIWGPTWSLAVEEHFYIILTLIFVVLKYVTKNNMFKHVPQIFIAIAILCLVLRFFTSFHSTEFDFIEHYAPTHLRIDSLMFGVLISYFYYFKPEKLTVIYKKKYLVLVLSALSLTPYFFFGREYCVNHNLPNIISTFGFTHQYIAFGLILVSFWDMQVKENLFTKMLAAIGKNSYASYLWHSPIIYFMELYFHNIWYTLLYLAAVFIVSYISTRLVEIPFLNLRDKIFPSKSGMIKKR